MVQTSDEILITEISGLAEILRRPVESWIELLGERGLKLPAVVLEDPALCRNLVRLVASSEFAAAALLRNWEWFVDALEAGQHTCWPDQSAWGDIARAEAATATDPDIAKAALRQLRQRGLVQILWRSCDPQYDLWQALQSLSGLADILVETARSSDCAGDGQAGWRRTQFLVGYRPDIHLPGGGGNRRTPDAVSS
jgi:hypothetical protein